MRKITAQATKAFYNGVSFKSGNTEVKSSRDGVGLFLHGNRIAYKNSEGQLFISSCGWSTTTTKERLNGILDLKGIYIKQKNFQWFLVTNDGMIEFYDNMEVVF